VQILSGVRRVIHSEVVSVDLVELEALVALEVLGQIFPSTTYSKPLVAKLARGDGQGEARHFRRMKY
jgi:hypothetical protein